MRRLLCLIPLALSAQSESGDAKLFEAVHRNDTAALRAALRSGAHVNAVDSLGVTPLMQAGAYCSIDCMGILLSAGADVNVASNAGFTPLMWSVFDPAKIRLLLEKGANVNARSHDGNTALILARQNSLSDAVPVLLRAGATDEDGMDAQGHHLLKLSRDTLLPERSIGIEFMHMVARSKPVMLPVYLRNGPPEPVSAMLDAGAALNEPVPFVTLALPPLGFAALQGSLAQTRELLSRGANPNRKGSRGMTPLMSAAAAEFPDPEIIGLLLSKGAEINAQDEDKRTALDWALLQGDTAAARQLRAAGGKSAAPPAPAPAFVEHPRAPAEAIQKAVALLQPAGPRFFKSSGGCISCHSNSLPGIAARKAADRNIAVDSALLGHAEKAAMATWEPVQESLAVGASSIPGLIANVSYELMAMAETGFPGNFTTDAAALSLLRLQRADGSWSISDTRPPLGLGDMKWTALTVRGLMTYLPRGLRAERDEAVKRARAYLTGSPARTTQDEAFRVLGLSWSGTSSGAPKPPVRALLQLQRPDGGWGQVPTMASDAYATGQALFALQATGMQPADPAYRRGIEYLLRTQLPDGSWFVQSRAVAFQPYQETGFPHGRNQFISSAATSWAVMALAPAVSSRKPPA